MITKEKLEAIRKRAEEATEAPWFYAVNIDEQTGEPDATPHIVSDNNVVIAINTCEEDTIFIANARQDIPMLLDEVERLQKALIDVLNSLVQDKDPDWAEEIAIRALKGKGYA
jgi:hypothetical protein